MSDTEIRAYAMKWRRDAPEIKFQFVPLTSSESESEPEADQAEAPADEAEAPAHEPGDEMVEDETDYEEDVGMDLSDYMDMS